MALNDEEGQGSEDGSDPEELEAPECEVMEMAERILEYRATLPDQLKNALTSFLAAQRPVLPHVSEPGTSGAPNSDAGQFASNKALLLADGDQNSEKISLLKDKLSGNVAAVRIVLKRLKECVPRTDKLDSQNFIVHPAFKRKKTS